MLEKLNRKTFVIIVGRANSGTRIIPQAMDSVGAYLGEPRNVAFDLLPEEHIYAACRLFGPFVKRNGKHSWNFTQVNKMEIPAEFIQHLEKYLAPLTLSDKEHIGWKIPNNNLIYPWLIRLFPKASFIHWIRHPEGNCVKMTGVDRLERWNVPFPKALLHEWNYRMRASSWKYHYDIVNDSPKPENFLRIRFEDYVLQQTFIKEKVGDFIGLDLEPIDLNPGKAGPYSNKYYRHYPFIKKAMDDLDYN